MDDDEIADALGNDLETITRLRKGKFHGNAGMVADLHQLAADVEYYQAMKKSSPEALEIHYYTLKRQHAAARKVMGE